MGIFSTINPYRSVGNPPNADNIEKYGKPERSLFTSTRLLSLKHKIEIVDEKNMLVYCAETKFPSLHDKTFVFDCIGNQIACIERKLFSFHQVHTIMMDNGKKFEVANELLYVVKKVINIKDLNWKIVGNVLALNFEIYDQSGDVVAIISQKAISLHDKYCIDIYQPKYEKTIVAILVTIQHMIRNGKNATANSGTQN